MTVARPNWVGDWERRRSRGAIRYIFVDSLLFPGTAYFIAAFAVGRWRTVSYGLLVSLLLAALGGICAGGIRWLQMEGRYKRFMVQQGGVPPIQAPPNNRWSGP